MVTRLSSKTFTKYKWPRWSMVFEQCRFSSMCTPRIVSVIRHDGRCFSKKHRTETKIVGQRHINSSRLPLWIEPSLSTAHARVKERKKNRICFSCLEQFLSRAFRRRDATPFELRRTSATNGRPIRPRFPLSPSIRLIVNILCLFIAQLNVPAYQSFVSSGTVYRVQLHVPMIGPVPKTVFR